MNSNGCEESLSLLFERVICMIIPMKSCASHRHCIWQDLFGPHQFWRQVFHDICFVVDLKDFKT